MSMARKIKCQVERVTNHGDRVYTVELNPDRPLPAFRPGQFLHLAVDEYDPAGFWPESRVFSIASSPVDRSKLTIIYSVKGQFTSRMEKELCVGKDVWVKLPYGEFVVDGGSDSVLIAGGTGITAFQAFIEGLSPDHPHKVVLLYGARRPELLLGQRLTEKKRAQGTNLQVFYFVEETSAVKSVVADASGVVAAVPNGIAIERMKPGRIHLDVLKDCSMSESAIYYLAGPPPMVSALSNELAQQGVSEARIRVDAWE